MGEEDGDERSAVKLPAGDWDEKWVRALVAPLSTWGATTLARAAVAEPTLLTSQPDTRHAPVLTQRAVSRPAWTWREE